MKQKFLNYLLLFILCNTSLELFAQETTEKLSSITLNIAKGKVSENVNETHVATLETKIENIITQSGIGSSDYNNNFVIEPKFIVTGVQKSSGGMRSVVVADCNFSLTVKQQNSGNIFSQFSKTIKGSGMSEAEAISNAISQIDPNDEKAVSFVAKAKDKIIAYYNQNCDMLIQKAEKERTIKNYGSALYMLLSIPEEASACYQKAQAKAKIVFKEASNFECKKSIQEAKAYAANKDFDNALETLSRVDPTGTCTTEAKTLIKKIDSETSDDKKKQWQYVFKALDGTIEIEKARATAMTNLTLYWLKQQPSKTIIIH